MSDRIPKVTIEDVMRIIRRDFSNYDSQVIMGILDEYLSDSDGSRVYLAALKLSEGNIEKLRDWIEQANTDFRDILSSAEYPRFHETGFVGADKLSQKEKKKLEEDDWKQYQKWLKKKT